MSATTTASIRLPGLSREIAVVRHDAHLLALNKPAGLLVAPDRWDPDRPNLASLLRQCIESRALWCRALGATYAANAHRLDRDTSGLLLFALTREALHELVRQFRSRAVEKTYVALVHGAPAETSFVVDVAVLPDPRRPGRMRTGRSGKPAVTRFNVLERYRGYALVEAAPETGRQHQVRVHLKSAGHPIVGDTDYGGHPLLLSRMKPRYRPSAEGERPLLARQALHAARLGFRHPATGAPMSLEAPLARDIEVALKYLRRFAA